MDSILVTTTTTMRVIVHLPVIFLALAVGAAALPSLNPDINDPLVEGSGTELVYPTPSSTP